jgi:alginate O-acetyltransferase complex protein AlgI
VITTSAAVHRFGSRLRVLLRAPVLLAFALFAIVDALAFGTSLYRNAVDPASSTGSFEAALRSFTAWHSDPRRDVLVVGDSRIYSGLDPAAAAAAASGHLRFLNAGVPGTTPRCWYYFLHAIDPSTNRFRAIVLPVDTYADSDSAIGSIDGDERVMDLRYVVFAVGPGQIPKLAGSFGGLRTPMTTAIDLLLRGPILRDDVQAFAADPAARFAALARARATPAYQPLAAHPRDETLRGLRVDFARDRIAYPPGVGADERRAMVVQVLRVAHHSPSYARYRRQWLYPIVRRYAAAGVPVIFVRIPTRPAHRSVTLKPEGTLAALQRSGLAHFISARRYVALERPRFFADHDHLNRAGSERFSRLLGRDVARALADPLPARDLALSPLPRAAPTKFYHLLRQAIGIGIPLEFQSYEFWMFVGVVALLFYASPFTWRRYVLLGASYYFYARWNGWYVVFLLTLTVSDFAIALWLQRTAGRTRRVLLAGGIAANLAFLGTFKYANFTTGTVSALIGMHQDPWLVSWIVPIGISFHTFQSISYLVDVYRGKTPAVRDPFDYALYLAFFPQLLSGPIVRAGLFFGELFHWRPPSAADVGYGGMRIAFGLFKKIALADQFAAVSDAYFGSVALHPGAPAAWSALFAFSMQIYFDFSGYTDIAIGCARLFGFVFPENFNLPYLATSVTDFWHRWHMTLSTWLRDYLYIPLGGSRRGELATLRNLMVTMLLGGLWHGAQWTFVAWGALHGVFLAAERVAGIGHGAQPKSRIGYALRAAITFLAVTLAWVLFRAQSFPTALAVYRALFAGGSGPSLLMGWTAVLAAGVLLFAAVRIVLGSRTPRLSWIELPRLAQAGALAALLIGVEVLSWPGAAQPFIYFKF